MEQFQEFRGKLTLLHYARLRVAENQAQWREMQDDFNAEHADFIEGRKAAEETLQSIEAEVRVDALALWNTIPNLEKTSIPGITIRENRVVGFDPDKALAWAMQHGLALKLDEAAYRKLALAGLSDMPSSISKAFTAAIASDLEAVLLSHNLIVEKP